MLMKSKILLIIALIGLGALPAFGQENLGRKLAGRILLQVEDKGQAWYVNPSDQKRYFLGRPADAFSIMRELGVGITNTDLSRIPTEYQSLPDLSFAKKNAGKIFLQVQNHGEAWYINPVTYQRYYLGRPVDAFSIMRSLSLGISNENLHLITIGRPEPPAPPSNPPQNNYDANPPLPPLPPSDSSTSVLDQAAASIRSGNSSQAQTYFIESMRKSIDYSVKNLSSDSRLLLANILSGATLTSSNASEKIYSATAYFSLKSMDVSLTFRVQKQANGGWLITNL